MIGNGDVSSPEDARRMLDETGCDGVMIGRAALGNPWMLYRTIQYLSSGELLPDPGAEENPCCHSPYGPSDCFEE